MIERTAYTVNSNCYADLQKVVGEHRDKDREFGSFALDNPITVRFDDHDTISFPAGSYASFYGERALMLTHLSSLEYFVLIDKNHSAQITGRDLADPELFDAWMASTWSLDCPPR